MYKYNYSNQKKFAYIILCRLLKPMICYIYTYMLLLSEFDSPIIIHSAAGAAGGSEAANVSIVRKDLDGE